MFDNSKELKLSIQQQLFHITDDDAQVFWSPGQELNSFAFYNPTTYSNVRKRLNIKVVHELPTQPIEKEYSISNFAKAAQNLAQHPLWKMLFSQTLSQYQDNNPEKPPFLNSLFSLATPTYFFPQPVLSQLSSHSLTQHGLQMQQLSEPHSDPQKDTTFLQHSSARSLSLSPAPESIAGQEPLEEFMESQRATQAHQVSSTNSCQGPLLKPSILQSRSADNAPKGKSAHLKPFKATQQHIIGLNSSKSFYSFWLIGTLYSFNLIYSSPYQRFKPCL